MEKDTEFYLNKLNSAKSTSEGLNIINDSSLEYSSHSFSEFFNEYLGLHPELKLSDIVRASGLSRQYAYEVINGNKNASRDKLIALCFAAGMNLCETDHALTYAKVGKLYAKDKRDAVLMLAIKMKSHENNCKNVTELNILLDEQGQDPLDI